MTMPTGVNQIEFYKAAKAKGVSVTSRYRGVCVTKKNNGKDICWRAQIDIKIDKGYKGVVIATRPLTADGEHECHMAYQRYITENNIQIIRQTKTNLCKTK